MANYVYSTLANDQRYVERGKNRTEVAAVFVAGKANVPNRHMFTVRGVSTPVSDEQLAVLRKNKVFQLHEKNGFVTVESRKVDADKVAKSMSNNDPSRPDTSERLASDKKKAPKANEGK